MCLIAICLPRVFRSQQYSTNWGLGPCKATQDAPHTQGLCTQMSIPYFLVLPYTSPEVLVLCPIPQRYLKHRPLDSTEPSPKGMVSSMDSTISLVSSIHSAAGTPHLHPPENMDGGSQPTLRILPDIWKLQRRLSNFSFPG